MKKVNDLEVNIGDKTYVIEVKSEKKKLRDKNYKPEEIFIDGVKHLQEHRSYWEDPNFIKLITSERRVKKIIESAFGNLEVGVKEIKEYKPKDKLALAMQQVRKSTEPFNTFLRDLYIKKSTSLGDGRVRKQRFKRNPVTPIVTHMDKDRKLNTVSSLDLATKLFPLPASKKAPYNRNPITGTGLYTYMKKNNLKTPVDIIKAYKTDKSLKIKTWENLVLILRQMNYFPDEVFEYATTAVSNTKERWNRHRIFREYELNGSGAVEDFCQYYKTHLKSKLPLKSLIHSDFIKDWCINNNVIFKSDENFRHNVKEMIKAWNKKYPKDKIPEKLK